MEKLSNWRLHFPEESDRRTCKKILKQFKKLWAGKTRHIDLDSIGKVYLIGNMADGEHQKRTTHISQVDIVENNYICMFTREKIYIVNPDEASKMMLEMIS